jgi:uncharacterized protein (DUF58 family)
VYLVVSALLAFMSISGIFGKNNLSKISVELGFPEEVYAARPLPVRVTLRNGRRFLPAFLMRVKFEEHEVFFPYVDTGGEAIKHVTLTCRKRGLCEFRDPVISSVFPFSFFSRYKKLKKTFQLVVFPELKRCDLAVMYDQNSRLKGEKTSEKTGYESDMISIRQYVLGDPVKYINWKATAKTGELKTKELSALTFEPVVIDFEKVGIKDVEEKLSCIAYTVFHLFRKNIPIGLRIKETLFEPGTSTAHMRTMLKELALY